MSLTLFSDEFPFDIRHLIYSYLFPVRTILEFRYNRRGSSYWEIYPVCDTDNGYTLYGIFTLPDLSLLCTSRSARTECIRYLFMRNTIYVENRDLDMFWRHFRAEKMFLSAMKLDVDFHNYPGHKVYNLAHMLLEHASNLTSLKVCSVIRVDDASSYHPDVFNEFLNVFLNFFRLLQALPLSKAIVRAVAGLSPTETLHQARVTRWVERAEELLLRDPDLPHEPLEFLYVDHSARPLERAMNNEGVIMGWWYMIK